MLLNHDFVYECLMTITYEQCGSSGNNRHACRSTRDNTEHGREQDHGVFNAWKLPTLL